MGRYDIGIIGTGPAGLSAALTAKIRNKKILLLGRKNLSEKVEKAHIVQNYLGLPNYSGVDMVKVFQQQLSIMNIAVTEDKATVIYNMGEYFEIQTAAGAMYETTSIILAAGTTVTHFFAGEKLFLGRGVSYCATCDAPLYKGKVVAIIADSAAEESEVDFMAEIAAKVYYIPLYQGDIHVSSSVTVVHEIPVSIAGTSKVSQLQTEDAVYEVDGVFILRESVAPDQLVPGLTTESGYVAVNRQMETVMKGCFACGDITGRPYQYSKAAGEGNVAALSAVSYVDRNRHK
ncbi:MAG: NAD(P)/FAD-dependent oxidoreductase [Megasphaera sp.]|jgi:thioredoxin reductase (NADPH)|uniref:NAD(P)/FAD-dependent oxidoreductase n=1 Tax=Megasphaera sueciensis TaxID=349094 RepID=UPI002ACB0CCA|nr:NAD(P)/FAD-dependent oxidoreductase [Megasphaera sp.]MCI1822757.1 NAD(P)/FAD-dependent oxidoreductase [Megasphaera sp.]